MRRKYLSLARCLLFSITHLIHSLTYYAPRPPSKTVTNKMTCAQFQRNVAQTEAGQTLDAALLKVIKDYVMYFLPSFLCVSLHLPLLILSLSPYLISLFILSLSLSLSFHYFQTVYNNIREAPLPRPPAAAPEHSTPAASTPAHAIGSQGRQSQAQTPASMVRRMEALSASKLGKESYIYIYIYRRDRWCVFLFFYLSIYSLLVLAAPPAQRPTCGCAATFWRG